MNPASKAHQQDFFSDSSSEPDYKLYTDGACWGNPGISSAGMVIYDSENNEIFKGAVYLGQGTNNTAEYSAILEGLLVAKRLDIKNLKVFSDSELIIKQLNGEYKVKAENLKIYKDRITDIRRSFNSVSFKHLRREFTDQPHKMAESILKNRTKK
jgi:ribonuclease HI